MQGAAMAGAPELIHRDLAVRIAYLGPDGKIHYALSGNRSDTFRATLDDAGNSFTKAPAAVSKRYEGGTRFGRYSRDGKWIAYDTDWRGTPKIVVQNLETGAERERVSPFTRVSSIEWYPDGTALLVHGQTRRDLPFGLYRFDLGTGGVSAVLEAKGLAGDLATNPTFSPDGRYVYLKFWDMPENFDPNDYTRAHIARLEVATGRVTEVFRPKAPAYVRLFALSADGTRIVYGFRTADRKDAYAVAPVAGGEPRVIFECPGKEWSRGYSALTFTGDGRGVMIHRVMNRKPTDSAPAAQIDELWHIPLDGGEPKMLHDTGGWTLTMMGRPNSREVMWQAARVAPWEFWSMENVTGPMTRAKR
jgi:hypothetical protein